MKNAPVRLVSFWWRLVNILSYKGSLLWTFPIQLTPLHFSLLLTIQLTPPHFSLLLTIQFTPPHFSLLLSHGNEYKHTISHSFLVMENTHSLFSGILPII
jgi:hypothetical protein